MLHAWYKCLIASTQFTTPIPHLAKNSEEPFTRHASPGAFARMLPHVLLLWAFRGLAAAVLVRQIAVTAGHPFCQLLRLHFWPNGSKQNLEHTV